MAGASGLKAGGVFVRFILQNLRAFGRADAGIVALEWAAIAAAVVVGGIVFVWLVMTHIENDASSVGTGIGNAATMTVKQLPP